VELLHRFYLSGGLRYTEIAVIGVIAAAVLAIAGLVAWIILSRLLGWWRVRADRRRRMRIAVTSPAAVAEFLADTVLFRDLPPETLEEVAAALQPIQVPRREFVIRAGTEADRLFIVVSGRLEVVRHVADDKVVAVAEMFPGDVLGEIGVIRGEARSRSIRCATRSILLALDKEDFERLVLPHISRGDVEQAVQKIGFLQNVDLVKNWSQESLSAFARLAKITEYNEGDVVMLEGEANLFLHLVHRGEFEVTQKGKRLRRLKQGASFGEVGMLQNNAATVTVVATVPGSCLVVAKTDFLRFITQDFAISLEFEQLGAKGLGRKATRAKKGPGFHALRG
jgi:CRP-like cAMP-binding protein